MIIQTPSGLKIYFSEVFPHEAISDAIRISLSDKVMMETPDERRAQINTYEPVFCNGKCGFFMGYKIELANQVSKLI